MEQLTKEQAIALGDSGEWRDWTSKDIVSFQLYQDRLAIPFDKFHKALEDVLERPVWTHELADRNRIQAEVEGKIPKPTFGDIMSLIPEKKRIIIMTGEGEK